ncbi:Enoyl-CoA hydratase/carnithine racemase [Pseudoxanthomonas sp. GM95]|uniref:enoyl-CoA hydratase n=1 Tax=Pseudoxanthomonas sp. GM95 TaxID=1881043 RepID=UPI0008C252DE|nr:enoyl-CoA hydratase [Pseudoxanthomonas sp. GM95]SEL17624.1 Enoyl-CoA hydratase/carnithine racemase [Pseudoxanthomonas sp. GM95]
MNDTAASAQVLERVISPGIVEVVIDRPERRNAMTLQMYELMLGIMAKLQEDASVRCIMIRGAGGKSFVAGTDIDHFREFTSGAQGVAYEAMIEKVIGAVERITVPTIAVIDGWAAGGGLALATACDFRVCSAGSKFGAPIAKTLSNTLSARNLARLIAGFGVPRVKKMLMLADFVDAPEALACGYVHQIAQADELEASALALAQRLPPLSQVTQHAVKESIRRVVMEHSFSDDDLVAAVYGSAAFHDAVAAFGSKTNNKR